MDGLPSADISLFEDFRFDKRGGVLSRWDENGDFVPLEIGSRALDILGVLVERLGDLISRAEIIVARLTGCGGRRRQSERATRGAAPHPRS
jgi:hypothetical protein